MQPDISLLTSNQVAKILGVQPTTIEKWRNQKRGPEYIRVGGLVRYHPSAIEHYLQSRTQQTNCSAPAAA